MFANLDMAHIFKCLELAFRLNIEELKQKSVDYAIQHKDEIQENAEWELLVQQHPQISIQFIRRLTTEANELKQRNEQLEAQRCFHQFHTSYLNHLNSSPSTAPTTNAEG